jgi:hypothetical protein
MNRLKKRRLELGGGFFSNLMSPHKSKFSKKMA